MRFLPKTAILLALNQAYDGAARGHSKVSRSAADIPYSTVPAIFRCPLMAVLQRIYGA